MPARKFPRIDQKSRDKIQATQLVKRLQSHALGEIDLDASQIRSIEILLRKCLPDLQSVTLEGGDTPIAFEKVVREIVSPANTNR